MKFRPSTIDRLLAQVPEEWQIEGLKVVKEEYDRRERGDLTKEEREYLERVHALARSFAKTRDTIIANALNNTFTGSDANT